MDANCGHFSSSLAVRKFFNRNTLSIEPAPLTAVALLILAYVEQRGR